MLSLSYLNFIRSVVGIVNGGNIHNPLLRIFLIFVVDVVLRIDPQS